MDEQIQQKFLIDINYSLKSLQPLTQPIFHLNQGCLFNETEFQDESNNNNNLEIICPVCNKKGKFIKRYQFDDQNEQKYQLYFQESTFLFHRIKKTQYTLDSISKNTQVKQLQQKMMKQLNEGLNIQEIKYKNLKRNVELFQLIKHFPQEPQFRQPTLLGIINNKLIIFFHSQKIYLELDIYDNTINKLINYGVINQIIYLKESIYLLINIDNYYQVYVGKFNQIFEQSQIQPIFYVKQVKNCTFISTAFLIQQDDGLFLIGKYFMNCVSHYGILDVLDKESIIKQINIYGLTDKSIIHYFQNGTLLIANKNQSILSQGEHQILQFDSNFTLLFQPLSINNSYSFDSLISFGEKLFLINSRELNRISTKCIVQSNGCNEISIQEIQILNHSSYLKVNMIPSIQTMFSSICCYLVGLSFNNDQKNIFPGILVYNNIRQSIEIELI